jgi:uncharacterized protein (DUF2141 family)
MRSTLLALPLALALSAPVKAAGVRVEVEGIEPGGGAVYVTLCQGGLSEGACARGRKLSDSLPRLSIVFDDVTPGTYAVATFQDQSGDGRLDRTGLGLPLEPYGLSGNAGRRARPDFTDAAFPVQEPGAAVRVSLSRVLPRR